MTYYFQAGEFLFQIIPEKDLCFIFKSGKPLWAGCKDQLIEILEAVRN